MGLLKLCFPKGCQLFSDVYEAITLDPTTLADFFSNATGLFFVNFTA